jgi:hypothetical protein
LLKPDAVTPSTSAPPPTFLLSALICLSTAAAPASAAGAAAGAAGCGCCRCGCAVAAACDGAAAAGLLAGSLLQAQKGQTHEYSCVCEGGCSNAEASRARCIQ